MTLRVSSDALPDASLDVLRQACAHRALAVLELSLGKCSHSLDWSFCPIVQQNGHRCVPADVTEVEWLQLPESTSFVMLIIWSGDACPASRNTLRTTPTTMNATTRTLDVRSVELMHRFDQMMGTYSALGVGDEMELNVDHDPTCIYYTLKADYGDARFTFQYLEEGPETWRVLIEKRGERDGES